MAPLKAEILGLRLNLSAPNSYMAEWVKRHLQKEILQATAKVLNVLPEEIAIKFGVFESTPSQSPVPCANILERVLPKTSSQAVLPIKTSVTPCEWRFKFEDFVTGPSNNLAVAAARDMAVSGQVRTLFVNSSAGLGKTHLVQAAGQALCGNGPLKVAYLTSDQFASRFVAAMRAKELEEFKQYLCGLDALLLEDVHFLQRKKAMQEMILGVVKHLQNKGARVIFTSSFSPRQMREMDSQLISHFCSGILAGMERPTLEMRREILQRKAKNFQVALPEDVCDLLSRRLSSDVRQLESCLKSMIFKARLLNSGLNLELAMETCGNYAANESAPDIAYIVRLVCESFGLTEQQLRSKSRRQEYVHGRNTAFYLARKHTEMSLEEIGCIFNRKHSTVVRGITQVEQEIAKESRQGHQFARVVTMIERKCGLSE